MLRGEATNTNFIVISLTWQRLEPTIYYTLYHRCDRLYDGKYYSKYRLIGGSLTSSEQYFNFIHDENKLSSNKSDIKDGTRVCLLNTIWLAEFKVECQKISLSKGPVATPPARWELLQQACYVQGAWHPPCTRFSFSSTPPVCQLCILFVQQNKQTVLLEGLYLTMEKLCHDSIPHSSRGHNRVSKTSHSTIMHISFWQNTFL